jgi:ATP-dependent RNA helicase SUPV3L1/SUV3
MRRKLWKAWNRLPLTPPPTNTEDVVEVFYTFTWAPRPRPNHRPARNDEARKPRADRAAPAAATDGATADAPRPQNRRDKPQRDQPPGIKPRAIRPLATGARATMAPAATIDRGKGGPKGNKGRKPDAPQTFAAAAPRKSDKIDMDNPFAAALMGLKIKG